MSGLRPVVGVLAAFCACTTLAVAVVPQLHFAYRSDSVHVALETTATLAGLVLGYLLLGRFRRHCSLADLVLSAGLILLALSNLVFLALPAVFRTGGVQMTAWGALTASLMASWMIALASLLAPRPPAASMSRAIVAVLGGTLLLFAAIVLWLALFGDGLPSAVVASTVPIGSNRPDLGGAAIVPQVQALIAIAYAVAAYGFVRRSERTGDSLSAWLALACVLAAAARANYMLYPSLYSGWVYTGDVFRLGFYLVLLLGAAREVSSYWTSAVEVAQLEERRRIARDLHDGLAQEVALIARNADLLRSRPDDAGLVERILAATERARLQSRSVISALTTPVEEPLDRAVTDAATTAAARYGTSVDLRLASGIVVSPAQREALVRVVSEAIANAARHSGADDVRIELERVNGSARLAVVDAGRGFGASNGTRPGFGLVSMRERVEELGGSFRVRSRPGHGTRVEVML